MANFMNNSRSGGRRDFGGRSSDRASMHQAVCSSCGKDCEVPFRPTGSKPVYCSSCFETNGGSSSRRNEGRSFDRPHFRDRNRQMFDAICEKCGDKCQLPFKPTSGKPIYCDHCFGKKDTNRASITEQCHCEKKIESLNTKLDQILKLLSPAPTVAAIEMTEVEKLINKTSDDQLIEVVVPPKKKRAVKKAATI